MSRPALWRCKVRGGRSWGHGGPDAGRRHNVDRHMQCGATAHLTAETAFGFVPNYSGQVTG